MKCFKIFLKVFFHHDIIMIIIIIKFETFLHLLHVDAATRFFEKV
jgi:hypothetical protein